MAEQLLDALQVDAGLASMMKEGAGWLTDPNSGSMAAAPEHLMYLAEHLGAEQDPVWLEEETEPFEAGTPSRELYPVVAVDLHLSAMRDLKVQERQRHARHPI